jgi:hypothetical protein
MRRFVFAPRWVAGHVTVIVIVVTCLFLGRWQWGVSQHTHSLQNMAYALQWPMFAVFFAVMWWRMLRLECRKLDGEFDEELDEEFDEEEPEASEAGRAPADARPARPDGEKAAARQKPVPAVEETDEDAELAAYNRMLAELAARDNAR